MQESLNLNFHGIGIKVGGLSQGLKNDLLHDFNYFISSNNSKILTSSLKIWVHPKSLVHGNWVGFLRTKISKKCFSFWKQQKIIFFGDTFVEYQYSDKQARVYGDEIQSIYECLYFIILSFVGERLDERAMHRIHGCAIEKNNQAGIILAGSGTGKSTLLLELLSKDSEMKWLSDDTPVLNNNNIIAFPQRIAVPENPNIVSSAHRVFNRFGFRKKYVLSSSYFQKQICKQTQLDYFLICPKRKKSKASIQIASKLSLLIALIKWLVIGYETPQIWQLYLRFSFFDCIKKSKILFSRLKLAIKLLISVPAYQFQLSDDVSESVKVLNRFLMDGIDSQRSSDGFLNNVPTSN